jgi:hypothetical protein
MAIQGNPDPKVFILAEKSGPALVRLSLDLMSTLFSMHHTSGSMWIGQKVSAVSCLMQVINISLLDQVIAFSPERLLATS